MVNPDVTGGGVKPELPHQFGQLNELLLAGQDRPPPDHRVEVHVGEAGGADHRTQFVEHRPRLPHPAETAQQRTEVVDREDRRAIDAVVRGVGEEPVDEMGAEPAEGLPRHRAGIEQFAVGAAARMDVHPVVIGPHQAELDPVDVPRREKSLIEAVLQKGSVVVIVVVEDEIVDAVVGGGGDLPLHDLRERFIDISPQRPERLMVPLKAGKRLLHQLPLAPAGAVHLGVSPVVAVVVREIVASDIDTFLLHGKTSVPFPAIIPRNRERRYNRITFFYHDLTNSTPLPLRADNAAEFPTPSRVRRSGAASSSRGGGRAA